MFFSRSIPKSTSGLIRSTLLLRRRLLKTKTDTQSSLAADHMMRAVIELNRAHKALEASGSTSTPVPAKDT